VRYLYKLFETEPTGVAGWIRERRLERCRRDLLDPALAERPVSAVAARWGLTNAAHFSRAFRAAYGLSPLAYRAMAGGSSP
jgi:AraC-like DNA-binding protein